MLICITLIAILIADISLVISFYMIWISFVVALSSVIIPLFFLQKGIELIDPVHVSFLTPFVPIITYSLQFVVGGYIFIWSEAILMGLLTILIVSAAYYKAKQTRNQ